MRDFFCIAQNVYDHLEDEISKYLFERRMKFYYTRDMSCITDIPCEYRNLSADIEQFAKKLYTGTEKKVIFGVGANGKVLAQTHKGLFEAFIDNYCTDRKEENTQLPIYSLEEYMELKGNIENVKFVISVSNPASQNSIEKQLIDNGANKENIFKVIYDWRNNCSQYFDLFVPRMNESFVDCGCWDGGTAFRFAGWCGKLGYNKIWSFEPDKKSYEECKKVLSVLSNCEVYPYGVSDKYGKVSFLDNGNEDARIVHNNEDDDNLDVIETISLDKFLENETVTFIKMDIEGAEYDAIVGASQIIREQKPRLAISIYHNTEHMFTIPQLLLELRPDYKLYIRQYSLYANETILYAE